MYLGLDLGTSSLKAILVDGGGVIRWVGEERYEVLMSHARAEIAADVWWEACVRALREAPVELRSEVRAVGLSGQMHGVVLVGVDGEPVGNAILWPDRRAGEQLAVFEDLVGVEPGVLGNPVVPGMPGPVLSWLRAHEPDVLDRAVAVVAPKDWVRSRLTAESPIVTDVSDASATLMYDVSADTWSDSVVSAIGIRPSLLPDVVDSGSQAGVLSAAASAALGIPSRIPVAVGAGDAAAALLGLGVESSGRVVVNVGTGAQVLAVVDAPDPALVGSGLHQFRSASASGRWYVMAPIINAGLALSWVRGVLGMEWDEMYGQARDAIERFDADPRFVPFLAGERDPEIGLGAHAAWVGLSTEHDAAAMARSAVLGVTAYLARRVRAVLGISGADQVELSGGATRHADWAQLLATLIGAELRLAPDTHASARGAVVLAARACGEALVPPPRRATVGPQPELADAAESVMRATAPAAR